MHPAPGCFQYSLAPLSAGVHHPLPGAAHKLCHLRNTQKQSCPYQPRSASPFSPLPLLCLLTPHLQVRFLSEGLREEIPASWNIPYLRVSKQEVGWRESHLSMLSVDCLRLHSVKFFFFLKSPNMWSKLNWAFF